MQGENITQQPCTSTCWNNILSFILSDYGDLTVKVQQQQFKPFTLFLCAKFSNPNVHTQMNNLPGQMQGICNLQVEFPLLPDFPTPKHKKVKIKNRHLHRI